MYFPGSIFYSLLLISLLVPIGIVRSGIEGRGDWFFGLSVVIAVYEIGQWMLVLACARASESRPRLRERRAATSPTIAAIVPAWNEEAALPFLLDSVLGQDDLPERILVSDDGSTDDTVASLKERYRLEFTGNLGRSSNYPHLQVLCKEHSGKGDSINRAVALSTEDVVLILDADTLLYPGSIRALRRTFSRYPHLDVVSGTLVPCCSDSWSGRLFQFLQRHEYARSHVWRSAWIYLDSNLIVSGACSAFRRQALTAIGGFDPASWVEDYEIVYRLQRYRRLRKEPCPMVSLPGLAVRTEAPESVYSFLRQRRRWAGGFLETIVRYRQMVGDRRCGTLGTFYLVLVAFSVVGPFYGPAWLVASIALAFQGPRTYPELFWLLVSSLISGVIVIVLATDLYRSSFHRKEVTRRGAIVEFFARPFLYLPLNTVAHAWGYISLPLRRRSW